MAPVFFHFQVPCGHFFLSYVAQQGTEHPLRGEVFVRHFACVSASSVIVLLDHVHGVSRLSCRFKSVKSWSERKHLSKTGILYNDWSSGGEIAGRAIAKPAALKTNI